MVSVAKGRKIGLAPCLVVCMAQNADLVPKVLTAYPLSKKSHPIQNQIPARCMIPRFDGAILFQEWKEALWDKFVTGAPRPRSPSELQYSDRKLRSRS